MTRQRCFLWLVALGVLLNSVAAHAQLESVTQNLERQIDLITTGRPGPPGGYDTAAVGVPVSPGMAYQIAMVSVWNDPEAKIERSDPVKREIQFSKDQQIVSMRIFEQGRDSAYIEIGSSPTGATFRAAEGVMKVCGQMNIACPTSAN